MKKIIIVASLALASLAATTLQSNAQAIIIQDGNSGYHHWHHPHHPMYRPYSHACTTRTVKSQSHGRTVMQTSRTCR